MMSRRPTKSSKTQPSGDFIALGSKRDEGGKSTASNIQRKVVPPSSAAATEARPVRRDSPALGMPQTKKPKHSMVQTLTPLGRPGELERRGSPLTQVYLFEENAKEVEPHDLLEAIEEAENSNDDENVERVICGAVKYLRANRSKPEQAMYLGLMYLAKTRPSFFGSEVIIEAMSSLLKRDITIGFKAKGNPVIPVLSCNVLMAAFQDDDNWPDSFVKVYLEDSLGERIWVDRADCKAFVENIQSAFNTKIPKISTDAKSEQTIASAGASPAHTGLDDEEQMDTDISKVSAVLEDVSSMVSPRYTYQQVNIETYVLDMIRDQLNRRQAMDGALRNTVKLMMCTCGYAEVRNMAVQRIEMWLQNPKLTKPAQDLLMSVCMNCDQHSTQDIEIISQLSRVRLKNKHILLHYMQCMRELINQHADNLKTLMTHVIYNELSQSRNPNNMAVLAHMFSHAPERAAKTMALIFQDLLCNKEDYVRALRALFREIVRSVRQDMSFTEFALGLMEERSDTKFKELEQPGKDRLLFALTDLICLTAYMSVSPTVRETAAANARGEQKDIEVLHQFQQNTAVIQRDAVWWLHTVVPKMFTVEPKLYVSYLRRVLFLDNSDAYHKMDNWPPEGDRSLLLRLVSEVPVLEDTLMRVLVIGLTRELRVAPSESIDIAELLVRRAALTYMEDFPVLKVERLEMVDALFHLSTYKHPENATFPKGYQPPTMAISTLYWKSWMILLIICSFNPETFGQAAWDNYPILRCLMEMIMTSNYVYPAPTMGTDEGLEEIKSQERQAAELEKQSILEFESYLAAGSRKEPINDSNSLLLKSLTNLDPSGPARKPPKEVLDGLEKLNQRMKIGQLLCRSRKPDFLMDIIKRQGTSQSMPWLADLVEGSESSLDILPVQCLCEFLLLDSNSTEGGEEYSKDDGSKVKSRPKKQQQLLARLQTLLHSPSSETRTIMEMLDYFLHRLSSQQSVQRQQAVKGLSVVLTKSHVELSSHFDIMEDEEDDEKMEIESSSLMKELREYRWLLEQLPSLPQFDDVKPHVCTALRKACEVETDAAAVSSYVIFLSQHSIELQLQEMDSLLLDLAQLIVERATLMNHILPQDGINNPCGELVLTAMVDIFFNYLQKAQQPTNEAISWSNTQDQILLQWKSGESATMNILVVHAMVILLTYPCPTNESKFSELLESWFPEGEDPPSAYLVDTSEEALLLPDWLKLRMIRSSNQRLVDAALQDLEPKQLSLFVQSFGIPVQSMSKLLEYLDKAVDIDCLTMEQVVVDKNYMAQLVEVQHMRGAQGGEKFTKMLLEGQEKEPEEIEDTELSSRPRVRRTESQLLFTPELPEFVHKDITQMMDILSKIFDDNSPTIERSQLFRTLQKTLAKENIQPAIISALKTLIKGKQNEPFVLSLKKNIHMSCPLIRILACKSSKDRKFVSLLHSLQKVLADSKSALSTLVNDTLVKLANKGHMVKVKATITEKLEKSGATLPNIVEEVHKEGSNTSIPSISTLKQESENIVNRSITRSLSKAGDFSTMTKTLCELLIQTPDGPLSSSTTGLIVDWLSLLDPEMISSCTDLQHQLLFAKKQGTIIDGKSGLSSTTSPSKDCLSDMILGSCQPLLLALLVHQSNWETLKKSIDALLKNEAAVNRYNATRALDFLWACLHIPKLWQGRDKTLPRNYKQEDILGLSEFQVQLLSKYIIKEAASVNQLDTTTHNGDSISTAACNVITQRIGLLKKCCYDNESLLRAVIDGLGDTVRNNGPAAALYSQILLELYLHVPSVSNHMEKDVDVPKDIPASYRSSSQLDILSHRVISSLSAAKMGKKSQCKMYDANIACRKFAAQHPMLFLRQLPMLASALQGQSSGTFGEIKHKNQLFLYTHILGILELLQPYLFHVQYEKPFSEVLQSFFQLIRLHGLENRQIASLVTKFVKLIHNFQCADASLASRVLHCYTEELTALSKLYPDLTILRSLLAGLVVPRQDDSVEVSPLPPPPRPPSPWTTAQLAPFLQQIAKGNSTEDVLSVLQDLDETSKRKVDIIEHFVSDLKRLMLDDNETVRSTAFNLMMRHVRQSPRDTEEFVAPYLRCLSHSSVEVVKTALHNMAEFIVLAGDNAVVLLQKAFEIAITSKLDTSTFLTEALQLLNMETML